MVRIFQILGSLYSTYFVQKKIVWYLTHVEHDSTSVRFGKAYKTKGSIYVSFMFFGTSFLFMNAHLTAHQDKVDERIGDLQKIFDHLRLPKKFSIKKTHESKVKLALENEILCLKKCKKICKINQKICN